MAAPPTHRADPTRRLARHLDVLRELGVVATLLPPKPATTARPAPTALLRLGERGRGHPWAVEHRPRVEAGALGPLVHHMRQLGAAAGRAILFTDHTTPNIARALRAEEVAFADLAGNAYLRDKDLFVWVVGRRPAKPAGTRRRDLHAAGLKLVFALLRDAGRPATHRELAARAGIALGGVGPILRELKQRRWIRPLPDGRIELLEPELMLRAWDEGWAHTLRPRLLLRTCRRAPRAQLAALPAVIARAGLATKVHVGGELGAALLTRHLRPERAALHVAELEPEDVMRELGLLPDEHGDVDLLAAFGELATASDERQTAVADPLLVRAELLVHPNDRLGEVAELLRTGAIAERWA